MASYSLSGTRGVAEWHWWQKAVEAATVPTVVEVGTHVYIMSSAARVRALECYGPFVLVSISNPLTWASLSVSIQLAYWHDCSCMLEEGR